MTVITPAASRIASPIECSSMVARHQAGDWGDVDPADAALNEEALGTGAQIHSQYRTGSGATLWIITEADRSVTTILTPEDY